MPKSKFLRLVIDTNLWISFLISERQRRLDSLLYLKKIRLLFSSELLDEINATVTKPKLKKYFSANAMEEMLLNLETYIELIEVKSTVKVCRDTKDNFLLALSKEGKADYLLTGDKDLLDLAKFSKSENLTISKFLEEVKHSC
jgi:putative PIN family toxin of toxin-antitoxin system